MKILGKHIYFFASNKDISAEKIKALAEGRAHIHGDPVRQQPVEPQKSLFEKKEASDGKN